jgi:serine/threonine-protein kinase
LQAPSSFSPDGTRLAYTELIPGAAAEVRTVRIENVSGRLRAGEPELFLKTPTFNAYPAFSPDGRWVAYSSAEGGVYEVHVRAFPDDGTRGQISNSGGLLPVWSRNGHELFYRTQDQRIMVVNYTTKDGRFVAGKPRLWVGSQLANVGVLGNFDLAPDGKRFVVLMAPEGERPRENRSHIMLALNFFDEVHRRLAEAGR